MLFRNAEGVNFGKLYAKQVFNPSATTQARNTISNTGKDYCLSQCPYENTQPKKDM